MPYASSIQIVNDANGAAYAFLADNGNLFQGQWNAEAQRWDQGRIVPGAFGARDLQVLVVDDLWPSSRTTKAVPGNAPGVVLAYRIGEGSSSQVVASFGAWNSDGGLSWAEPVVVSSGQGENEAFGLARGQTPGTVQLVLQKREPSSSPQELLAQFRNAPQEVINEKLDALATGARTDSDLYQSTLTILPTGQDGYSLQQSTEDYTPPSSANPALTLESDQQPTAPPAAPSGGNTLLSRAALAANAAPTPAPAPTLLGSSDLLGAAALPRTGVSFATDGSTSSQGGGFSGPFFNNSGFSWRSTLTAFAVPWRYELGSGITKGKLLYADNNDFSELDRSSLSGSIIEGNENNFEAASQSGQSILQPGSAFDSNQPFISADPSPENDVSKTRNPLNRLDFGGVSVTMGDPNIDFDKDYELVFKGLFGGLLAGQGGYSVANFSTISFGKDARSGISKGGDYGVYVKRNPLDPGGLDQGYTTGLKFGASVAGSLKTGYQYSSPNSGSDVNLLSFTAEESLGGDFSVYKATIYNTGARFIRSGQFNLYGLLEQEYNSDTGLPEWLQSIGLATGIAGDTLSLLSGPGILGKEFKNSGRLLGTGVNQFSSNGLGFLTDKDGLKGEIKTLQNTANAIGLTSAALSIGTIIGAASANFNQYGTASRGVGSEQVARLRWLSKYGYGIEGIIGAQENALWDFSGNPAGVDYKIVAFGSAGAALAFGGYVPLFQASWKWNIKPSTTSSTEQSAPAMALAAPAATPPNSSGSYEEASTGISYPMGYAPAFATDALYTTTDGPLASLTSTPTNLYLYQLSAFAAANLNANALTWTNSGAGPNLGAGNTGAGYLNDGDYTNVPLIGLLLPGSAPATASFTVTDGSIVSESFSVQLPPAQQGQPASGQYLALPQPTSGKYSFGLDVFQPVAGNPAPPLATDASSVHAAMPLFNIDTNFTSLLAVNPIARIQQQIPLNDQQSTSYLATQASASSSSNDSKLTSYANVAVVLYGTATAQAPQQVTTLNPGTATVNLVNGKLISFTLDQPLYFANQTGYSYSLVPDLATALGNTSIVNPSLSVTPQLQGLADFTDQYSFTANPTASNAGVYLSAGLIDTLPLLSSYGHWPVQNRVTYVEGANTVYLNTTNGTALTPSDLTLSNLSKYPDQYQFSAASEPTSITDTASNTTYVFWVEASNPVIPLTGSDGEANYQAFMNALYGNQRINYSYATTNPAGTNTKWYPTSPTDLHSSPGNIITNLRAFSVQVEVNGAPQTRSLLVWSELPISAIQKAENAAKTGSPLPDSPQAKLYAGFINPNAGTITGGYAWKQLFNDSNGNTTIKEIPWTSDSGSGLSIADLSAASQLIQVPSDPIFSGTIDATTLKVSSLSQGTIEVGELLVGAGVAAGTTITGITTAATATTAGVYTLSSASSVATTTTLRTLPESKTYSYSSFNGSFSGTAGSNGYTTLTVSGLSGSLQIGDRVLGLGLPRGSFVTQVQSSGVYTLNQGPASAGGSYGLAALPGGSSGATDTVLTPVLSWSQAVRTPYTEAVLASQPALFLPLGSLQSGSNAINIGSANVNTETFASSTGLNTAIAGALTKSTASAVQNVQGLGVLATGLGSTNKPILDLLRNIPQADRNSAQSDPVAIFSGTIDATTLTVSSLSQGTLEVGELLVGAGVAAGTTITGITTAATATTAGVYTLSSASSVATTTTLRTLPESKTYSYSSFNGSFSGTGGSNGYTTLTVSGLSGSLQIGDRVLGLGLPGGSFVVQVQSSGVYTLNQGPASAGGSYGLAALPGGSSSPYSIEFWTQLAPGSNPAGAGLVNLGQASAAALPDRPAATPEGWLLSSSFVVEQLTWQDALKLGLETSLGSNTANDLYGWRWALVADGANTTAMGGNGGANLNRSALVLDNLVVGDRIEGVNTFLANYGLTSSELLGIDGTPADQIAAVPTTQLQFSTDLTSNAAVKAEVAETTLNGVAIDTSSAVMNGGIVTNGAASVALAAMFDQLSTFELKTGQAKVNFSLNPNTQTNPPAPSTPSSTQLETYGGLALQFALLPGPAVSVNGSGQIAFDVAPGKTLLSTVGTDLRNGDWHYVVASFLPDYVTYSADGSLVDVASNVGTASLYIDGKQVASVANVVNPYAPSNVNDYAQLLSDNAQGSIDLVALYDKALTTLSEPQSVSSWPLPTGQDALALMKEAGFVVASKTPNPGAIPGAVSNHWLAHTVDPNDALNSTYTATLIPDGDGGGTWSQATALNPVAAPQATIPSASTPAAQQDLLIAITPSDWSKPGWFSTAATTTATTGTTTTAATTAATFNPAGNDLKAITVQLTPSSTGDTVVRTLTPEQVLMGTKGQTSLAELQPLAQDQDFNYTFLSNTPALNLLISRQPNANDSGDSNSLDPKLIYTASVTLTFEDGSTVSNTPSGSSSSSSGTGLALGFSNSLASELKATSSTSSKALATAAVLEEAPLQLKYVDSGEVFSSQSTTADSPASTFGMSQAAGYSANSNGTTQNGWLAIAQPRSTNAKSDPAGRVWINYTGQFTLDASTNQRTASTDAANAPSTWLNALASSNFNPQAPNLPLLNSALYKSSVGGLLIKADPSAGWGQNFGANMLVADVNNDGTQDLIISAPQANGGGGVVVVDGKWIASNLTASTGETILDLSNPSNLGPYVTVLTPGTVNTTGIDITTAAGFGTALAFDSITNTLWIGAPNYLRTLDSSTTPNASTQPIGALYSYSTSAYTNSWDSGKATILSGAILGSGGTLTTTQAGNTSSTSYWGAQFGTAVAVSSSGELAVSAPGVVGSMLYTGTEAANQVYVQGNRNYKAEVPDGVLNSIQLGVAINATGGASSPLLKPISSLTAKNLTSQQKAFLTLLKNQAVTQVAPATTQNNQALQSGAVGAVVMFQPKTNYTGLANSAITPEAIAGLNGTTFIGANPINTQGDSGFGSSLTFADLTNTNSQQLIVGASSSNGGGLVYTIDPSAPGTDISLGSNQYLAILAATNVFTAAEAFDGLGNGLVSLGDVNNDDYDDVLLQAYNASSGAGNAYVLFGSDQLATAASNAGLASLASGSIGTIAYKQGSSGTIAILSELGSAGSLTGQGNYGAGDINADGYNDILLGSGALANAYLTWGHSYLESITDLQLSKLASNTGYLLDGLATSNQGSLRSIGDFNADGYGDFISINPGSNLTTVRIELGANTQEILADAAYSYYTFTVANGTEVLPGGDINGDGIDDIVLFLDHNLSSAADGNQGAGSSTGILYGRSSADLPLGSGFGFIAPVDPSTSVPLAPLPGLAVEQAGGEVGRTDATPSVIAVGDTLYAAVKGSGDTTLWFTQSTDGGNSWDNWTDLTSSNAGFSTSTGPSLAYFNETLYLSFVDSAGALSLSSWDPTSNNPAAWSTPYQLSNSANPGASYSSSYSPQLFERGDALGITWTASDDSPAITWSNNLASASSTSSPALAMIGSTVYMAIQGANNSIQWTSSTDNGAKWAAWQTISGITTSAQPSLAVMNGILYLSYINSSQINITSFDSGTNNWSASYAIPGTIDPAFASLIAETVGGVQQLAAYYVDAKNSRIYKAYSTSPNQSSGWVAGIDGWLSNQYASAPLALTSYKGQTYIAYQAGNIGSPGDIYFTTNSQDLNNGEDWTSELAASPGSATGIGLSSGPNGLILSYGNSSSPSVLQIAQFSEHNGSWTQADIYNEQLPSNLSNNVSILYLGEGTELLLAGANTPDDVSGVQAGTVVLDNESLTYVYSSYSTTPDGSNAKGSWATPTQLLQRTESDSSINFVPITTTDAPSFTWLGDVPILALNNNGTINVYAGTQSGATLQLASSFLAPAGLSIVSAPVLTTTDTGLALTYTNSDGSISLQRLNLVSSNGTPLPGVQFTSEGGIDVSQADLQWQSTILTESNSGIISSLASTPVSVNGNLLLTNVRNTTSQDSQIWINAVPNASDPDSTTWLSTTVQLPDGSGGSILSQRAGADNLIGALTPGTWQDVASGAALSPAALARNGDTVYMAVQGTTNNLYWNSSTDNGVTWNSWQELPNTMGTYKAPSIAYFNNTLYLCYVAAGSQDLNITYLNGSTWETQYQISGQTATAASMITEGSNLAVYFVSEDNTDRILKSYTSTSSPGSTDWTNTSVQFLNSSGQSATQTASSNLALTRYNGQTYIAFQGGTSGTPSNTISLTTASDSVANGSSPVWTLLDVPAGIDPVLLGGVGLTSGSQGLVLTYTDTSNIDQVAVQLSNADVTDWAALDNSIGLSSTIGYTPLITADAQNPLLIAGMGSSSTSPPINVQLNGLNAQILNSAQTGSTISAIGDINADGFDDLAITANNVAYSPSGDFAASTTELVTGVRFVLGAATATALSSTNANDSTTVEQTVQIAGLYPQPSSSQAASTVTPVANLSGPTTLNLNGALGGSSYQISSTAVSTSTSPLSIADVTATSSHPSSLQQLFAKASATSTSIPTWHSALGTGSPALQTLSGFGDLNADGYVDYLAPDGLNIVFSSDGAIGYDVWSIRAAGDVNGNGVDDVLLTVSPAETAGQWLQTALLDGALFHVENNQFSLAKAEGSAQTNWSSAGLKEGLNPYQYAYSENTPKGLQQWVQPILNYQPTNTISSFSTSSTNTATVTIPGGGAETAASCISPDGTTYITTSGIGYIVVSYGVAGAPASSWATVELSTLAPAGGIVYGSAIYDNKIFIVIDNYYTPVGINIAWADLSSDLSQAASWSTYVPQGVSSGGTSLQLVNEGDRLALYYSTVTASEETNTSYPSSNINVTYSSDPVVSSSWGSTQAGTGFTGNPSAVQAESSGASSPSAIVATTFAATRFQGKTILAYYSGDYTKSSYALYTAQATSAKPGTSFTTQSTTFGIQPPTSNSPPSPPPLNLAASASQVYLMNNGNISIGSFSGQGTTSALQFSSQDSVGNFAAAIPFVSESDLYLAYLPLMKELGIVQADLTQPSPSQVSLAGYSIDGNIDINGDGFMDMLVSDPSDPADSVDNQYALFGGDYLNIASQVGTAGDDTLIGTPLADVIYTIGGSDRVISNGGADVIYTGSGDDQISIVDPGFIRIDAGSGFDVLQLEGQANQPYDFRLNVGAPEYFAGTKLRDIELITSRDFGANTLYFDAAAVNAINPDRILFLTPDASDTIILSQEFEANPSFNTTYAGSLWTAYAAGVQTTPANSSPTLIYVLNPSGASASDWLADHVLITDTPSAGSVAGDSSGTVVGPAQAARFTTSNFGEGLEVQAFTLTSGDAFAKYVVKRVDSSQTQVVTYSTTARKSKADTNVDYIAAFGRVVLEVGENNHEIWIPTKDALKLKNGSSITVEFEEHSYSGQKDFNLLIEANLDTLGGDAPVMSGFRAEVDEPTEKAQVSFHVDSNSKNLDQLTFTVSSRSSSDTLALDESHDVVINDFRLTQAPGASNGHNLDRDVNTNQQVSAMLEVNLNSKPGQLLVSVLGPDPLWQSTVQLLNGNQVRFQQDAPLTSWRADSGAGLVTFGLQSGSNNLTLISNAQGGSAGSLNSNNANGATSWQSTEGKAIGSRSITDGQNLKGSDWTPTASLDGVSLALLNLAVDGNQVTASFEGGVTGVFWQADGNAPSLLPVPVSVEVQRLAGYNNSLGFYSVDSITGMVAGINPGETGYLQAALARSQEEDLLLNASTLPAFGATATFNSLPLDTRERYGVLLLQNGDRSVIFSSFAAANEGGATQMVSLSDSSNSRVLGIEDMSVAKGLGDNDFNDIIVKFEGVSLGLF